MGMYTQLHLGVILKSDLDQNTKHILEYMLGESELEPREIPEHDLFRTSRWNYLFQYDSYYFDYKTAYLFKFDEIGNHYWFNVTCNLKNYDNEISKFLDWLYQYLDSGMTNEDEFIGYYRYEENDEPVHIYKKTMKSYSNAQETNSHT